MLKSFTLIHGTGGLLRVVCTWYESTELELETAFCRIRQIPVRFCRQRFDPYRLIIYTLKSLLVEHFYSNNLLATEFNIVMLSQKTVLINHWKGNGSI